MVNVKLEAECTLITSGTLIKDLRVLVEVAMVHSLLEKLNAFIQTCVFCLDKVQVVHQAPDQFLCPCCTYDEQK